MRYKYNDTPKINQTFNATIGDITLRWNSVFKSVTANSTLHEKILCPQENFKELLVAIHPTERKY